MTEPVRSSRNRWLIPTIVGAVVLVAVVIGVVIASADSDGENNANGSVPIANVQKACETWMGTYGGSTPDSDWCSQMGDWMNQQWRSGNMMGSMMWGNSARMRTACVRWMADAASSTTTPSGNARGWCNNMVEWMRDHSDGDWGGWMRSGNMMGN